MPDTYTQIIIQLVFAVEGRQSLIAPAHQEEVNKYITGIVKNRRSRMLGFSWRHTALMGQETNARHPTNIRLRWSRSEGGGSGYKHTAPLGQRDKCSASYKHSAPLEPAERRGSHYKHTAPLGQGDGAECL